MVGHGRRTCAAAEDGEWAHGRTANGGAGHCRAWPHWIDRRGRAATGGRLGRAAGPHGWEAGLCTGGVVGGGRGLPKGDGLILVRLAESVPSGHGFPHCLVSDDHARVASGETAMA